MTEPTKTDRFSFTEEQKANLRQWKSILDTEQAKVWHSEELEAIDSIHAIFREARFQEGNDLSGEQLNRLFSKMRILVNNRTLARNLYEDNGIAKFNSALRKLLYGMEPLVERVNQFFGLHRVGIATLAHFLSAFKNDDYPLITSQTFEVLNLDATQMETAYKQALEEHNISSPQSYYEKTLEYLQDMVIYREVKLFLGIGLYFDINNLLWLAREGLGTEEMPVTSVSLERDLRDYLANNPNALERGLRLIRKEYTTSAGDIDLLCQDKRGKYVVIETKKGRGSDAVVGQALRYIGSLSSEGKQARAIIVLNEPDERVDFAITPIRQLVKVKYYRVKFDISDSTEV